MVGGTRSQATAAAAAVHHQPTFEPSAIGVGGGGLAGLADHAAAAPPVTSTSRRSSGSLKREHPDDGDMEGSGISHSGQRGGAGGAADGNNTPLPDGRKRRAGAGSGSRGVANLTPEQLAKKRANDREAQRAIRERTRNEIESLKRRIEELTNQKPYQELQAVIKAKEAVEAENAEIKQRLATVIGMLQPLLGPSVVAGAHGGLSAVTENHTVTPPVYQHAPSSGYMPSQAILSAESPSNHVSTSNGTASPAGSIDIPGSYSQLKHSQNQHQQWQQNVVSDLVTGNSSRSFPVHTPNGSQVSSRFHQHQVSNHFAQQTQHRQSNQQGLLQQVPHQQPPQQGTQLPQLEDHQYRQQPQSQQLQAAVIDTNIEASLDPNLDPNLQPRLDPRLYTASPTDSNDVNMTSGFGGQSNAEDNSDRLGEIIPDFSTPVKNCPRTCPLDGMLQNTLQERRQRAAEGIAPSEIIGPRYPSVNSLLNPSATPQDERTLHPISQVFTDIVHAFPHMTGEPERIAIHFIMTLYLRWQVNPTRENYELMPPWLRPLPSQVTLPHPVWIDYCPFPRMRDRIVRDFAKADAAGLKSYWVNDDAKGSLIIGDSSSGAVKHHNAPYPEMDPPTPFNLFAGVYTDTISLNWPHNNRSSLLESTDSSSDPVITPAFETHLRNLDNWTLGPEFFHVMPHLNGLANLKTADGQIILARKA
ncbi:hypothetical protein MCOR27_006309 [Pyricularia oryzae]|nr:hypothetical protein MCOR19_007986 [Pyricularia oryzae]KAI6276778.1 hypothetical protein MCOR27_006309 [Pyricularia oryzae]KAI6373214.1 hypothetical protein MCOR31_003309 [Pyricularia oryzae]KAI6412512.1 hypothetical protein MCOR24_006729 [Pyricularia oryzae]KAI6423448.1 hypothetical protein MCOR21_008172 [Pyricularia oryzae]